MSILLAKMLQAFAAAALEGVHNRFASNSWPSLRRGKGAPIASIEASLAAETRPSSVAVVSSKPHAIYHQHGTRHVPQREFAPEAPEQAKAAARRAALAYTSARLRGLFRGGALR
jgi:hypothetical protein